MKLWTDNKKSLEVNLGGLQQGIKVKSTSKHNITIKVAGWCMPENDQTKLRAYFFFVYDKPIVTDLEKIFVE